MKRPFSSLLAFALSLALLTPAGAALAAASKGETIEVRGCGDLNAVAVDDPSADGGFVCECNAGYVDLDDGDGADCTTDWSGLLGMVVVPICLIAPEICNPTPPLPPRPPTEEDEEEQCRVCREDTEICLFVADSLKRECVDEFLPDLLVCTSEAQEICTSAESFPDPGLAFDVSPLEVCLREAASECQADYAARVQSCAEREAVPWEQDCDSDFNQCKSGLDQCEHPRPPGKDFPSGGFSAFSANTIGGMTAAEPESGSASVSGLPNAPIFGTALIATPITAVTTIALAADAPESASDATPAASCEGCGDVLAFRGTRKLGLPGAGQARGDLELGMRLTDGLFEMRDRDGHVFFGTSTVNGRRGRRIDLQLAPTLGAAPLLASALGELGISPDAVTDSQLARFRVKLRRDGSFKTQLEVRFTALVDGAPRAGRYRARLAGTDITSR